MITILFRPLAIVQVDQHICQELMQSVFNSIVRLLSWIPLLLLLAAVRLGLVLVGTLIILVIVTSLVRILTIVRLGLIVIRLIRL